MLLSKDDILELQSIIKYAGTLVLAVYREKQLAVAVKSDFTPVTEADQLSSAYIVAALKSRFPDIPVISEEDGLVAYEERKAWRYMWSVDPLDGTKEFVAKTGHFCINIALIEDGVPVFGMINNVLEGEIIWGGRGVVAMLNKMGSSVALKVLMPVGKRLKVAISHFNVQESEWQYINKLRMCGYEVEVVAAGASFKQCMIAKGEVDICPKFGKCSEWDLAAGEAIIRAAGGAVVSVENKGNVQYNKENMLNPPFIMFSKRIYELILKGNTEFLP